MRENKYNQLVKNTLILFVGTFGSKILSFLIVPLYTHYLTTSEYGTLDLFSTTIRFLIPILTLMIQESVVKFIVTDKHPKEKIINNCMAVLVYEIAIITLMIPVYKYMYTTWFLTFSFWIMLIINSYNTMMRQYLRALNKPVSISITGVVETVFSIGLNVLFLIGLNFGMNGYMLSTIITQSVVAILFTIYTDLPKVFSLKQIDKKVLKNMIKFSIPVIPNNLMWWIMSAGDKYVIRYYLGASANGMYSVALKLPTIISLLFSVFSQAWQYSALEEENNSGKKEFYENVLSMVITLLVVASSGLMLVIKPYFYIMVHKSYVNVWNVVPLLSIATVFNCLANFSGIIYFAKGETKKSFYTSLCGTIANLIFNFMLIGKIGLYGVAIGTILGYVIISAIRFYDMKRYIGVNYKYFIIFANIIILTIQAISSIFVTGKTFWILNIVCCLMLCTINVQNISKIITAATDKFLKKYKPFKG